MCGGIDMKWFYFSVMLFDCVMIWSTADAMFKFFNEAKPGMAALNLLGVIAWTLLLIENKNLIKEKTALLKNNQKKVKKNLEN